MKKYQLRVRARRAGSRLENQKQSVTTLLEGGKVHFASPSSSIQPVTAEFISTPNVPLPVVCYGPGGAQKFYPWQTP